MTDETLRRKAQQAIEAGKLPACRPESIWGGSGTGAVCTLCGEPVRPQELGYELEFAANGGNGGNGVGGNHSIHIPCFAAWEHERQRLQGFSGTSGALPDDSVDGTIGGCGGNTTYRPD